MTKLWRKGCDADKFLDLLLRTNQITVDTKPKDIKEMDKQGVFTGYSSQVFNNHLSKKREAMRTGKIDEDEIRATALGNVLQEKTPIKDTTVEMGESFC